MRDMDEKILVGMLWMVIGVFMDLMTIANKFNLVGVATIHLAVFVYLFIKVKQDRDF